MRHCARAYAAIRLLSDAKCLEGHTKTTFAGQALCPGVKVRGGGREAPIIQQLRFVRAVLLRSIPDEPYCFLEPRIDVCHVE